MPMFGYHFVEEDYINGLLYTYREYRIKYGALQINQTYMLSIWRRIDIDLLVISSFRVELVRFWPTWPLTLCITWHLVDQGINNARDHVLFVYWLFISQEEWDNETENSTSYHVLGDIYRSQLAHNNELVLVGSSAKTCLLLLLCRQVETDSTVPKAIPGNLYFYAET